jgi:hypothetical protein
VPKKEDSQPSQNDRIGEVRTSVQIPAASESAALRAQQLAVIARLVTRMLDDR